LFIFTMKLTVFGQSNATLELDSLIVEALQNNPDFKMLQSRLEAFNARVGPAGALPDPQIGFGINNLPMDTYSFEQEAMTQKSIFINQVIPFFGKRGLRKEIAELGTKIAESEVEEINLQIIQMVRSTYYDLYLIDKSIDLTEDNRLLMENVVNLSRVKYETGSGIQRDYLNSQLTLYKLDEQLIRLHQNQSTLKSQMNLLLNRPVDQPLGGPGILKIEPMAESLAESYQIARSTNPQLQEKSWTIEQSEKSEQMAKREYWPDFGIKLSYGQRESRPDFLLGVVSLNIPLFAGSKQGQKVQEARAAAQSARFGYESARNDIESKLRILWDDLNKNSKLSILYIDKIIPQAEQAYQSALSAYINDKLDYSSLIDNQMMLINYRVEHHKIISEYNKIKAEIAQVIGKR